jgi:hypothetical protein
MIGRGVLAIAAAEALMLGVTLMLALDIYAHRRVEELGGINVWGYRGVVAAQRRPNDIRIVLVGGTRAFGWGEPPSLGSQIRRLMLLAIDRPGGRIRPVTVINLGRLGALPASYPATLDHFAYLRPDIVCIYDDLGVRGAIPTERTSAIFELTGYAPILPLVLREKGFVWRFGDVRRGYEPIEPMQRDVATSAIRRAAGSALDAVGAGLAAADRAAARWVATPRSTDVSYAGAMIAGVETAHHHARAVVVAVSPADTAEQVENLRALTRALPAAVASSGWLKFVDLGADPRLRGPDLRLDGWNYGGVGTTLAAEALTPTFLSLIEQR